MIFEAANVYHSWSSVPWTLKFQSMYGWVFNTKKQSGVMRVFLFSGHFFPRSFFYGHFFRCLFRRHPILRSLFKNFTFLFLTLSDNTIFLLFISNPSRSCPLLFPVNQVFPILLSVYFSPIPLHTLLPFHFQN